MFWGTILLHLALLILGGRIPLYVPESTNASGTEEDEWVRWTPYELPVLPWSAAVVGLTLLFFFIVFYGNSSYQRFYQLYGHTVGIGGTTMEWVCLVRSCSTGLAEPERSTARWNATRFVLAAAHVLYYALHGESISEDEWRMIVLRQLLSESEVCLLKAYKGFRPFLAVCWALESAQTMCASAGQHGDGWTAWQFREVAFKFRGHCGQIVNLLKQPVPFPYFHLLNVIMLLQLLLLSYALACFPQIAPYFSILILVFATAVLIGMRGLAVQLSNRDHATPPPHHCHTTATPPHRHTTAMPLHHCHTATLPHCHTATPPHGHTARPPH
jgi:predicted membrane chloride channel (bestrophin family)